MDRVLPSTAIDPYGDGLVPQIVRAINQHIRDEGLKVGHPLPGEVTFAEKLSVSRAVVREAFRSLATLGIIVIGNGKRARVGGSDQWVLPALLDHAVFTGQVSIPQIFDVRRALETRSATLAAMRRSQAEAKEIVRLAAAMRAAENKPTEIMQYDIAFHETIATASRSSLYALMVKGFHSVTEQTVRISWTSTASPEELDRSLNCHEQIAGAIFDQNWREAERGMADHFEHAIMSMLRAGII